MLNSIGVKHDIRPIMGSIQSVPIGTQRHDPQAPPALPFITISREPGAGAWTLARQLVSEINIHAPTDEQWTCWDRELVEKIAGELKVSQRLIERFEEANRSWLGDFLSGLSQQPDVDDVRVYHRVAMTVRSLASAGRAVLVGRAGMFITRGMPLGIHVRLIAPYEHRLQQIMSLKQLSETKAAAHLKELEHNRHLFYKRFWNRDNVRDEDFTMVFNTAQLSTEQIINCLKAVLPAAARGPWKL